MPPKKKSKAEEGKSKKEDEKKEEPEEESEEEEPEGDESKAKAADEEDHGRGKRKRRSSVENSFEPVDFTMQGDGKSGVKIIKGRGKALKEFPSVVASIEKRSTEDVLFGHKFLFGNRGSNLKKKELINNLLEFSGYLKAVPKGYDAEKLDAEDEIEETKFSKKTFKLLLAQVKMLCALFNVEDSNDNGKYLNKEDMVDNLLDFLSQPNSDFIKGEADEVTKPKKKKDEAKRKSTTPKKARPKSPAKTQAPEEPFRLVREHEKGKKPSDGTLRQWVQAYVACFDMDTATTKHAIKTASDKFGVDLIGMKDRIKELLAEEM